LFGTPVLEETDVAATIEIPKTHHDLLAASTVAMSTLNDDGSIQTTAVWVLLGEDGVLRTSLAKARRKYQNLLARPQATIFSISPSNPFRTLEIRAAVEFRADPDRAFMAQLLAPYGPTLKMFAAQAAEDRVIVTFRPTRVRASG
jgi:PPOX class probable F420-dependent enzyme